VSGQQRNLEHHGVVEVLFDALFQGYMGQIEVVIVKMKVNSAQSAGQLSGQGGLS